MNDSCGTRTKQLTYSIEARFHDEPRTINVTLENKKVLDAAVIGGALAIET
jgi:hypothetical protein